MSGIGFSELVILFLIGLIVLGPERLPRVANQLGTWLGQARRMTRVMTRQLEDELATPSATRNGAGALLMDSNGFAGILSGEVQVSAGDFGLGASATLRISTRTTAVNRTVSLAGRSFDIVFGDDEVAAADGSPFVAVVGGSVPNPASMIRPARALRFATLVLLLAVGPGVAAAPPTSDGLRGGEAARPADYQDLVELFGTDREELGGFYDFQVCSIDPGPVEAIRAE